MSVYIHPLMTCVPNRNWRWTSSTHMVADTLEELHAFAAKIGLKRSWFQDKRLKHYDLNPGRFAKAIEAGAMLIPTREFAIRFIKPTRAQSAHLPSLPRRSHPRLRGLVIQPRRDSGATRETRGGGAGARPVQPERSRS